jgi:hypothetical protein
MLFQRPTELANLPNIAKGFVMRYRVCYHRIYDSKLFVMAETFTKFRDAQKAANAFTNRWGGALSPNSRYHYPYSPAWVEPYEETADPIQAEAREFVLSLREERESLGDG